MCKSGGQCVKEKDNIFHIQAFHVPKSTVTRSTREPFRSLTAASISNVVPSGSMLKSFASSITKDPPLHAFFFAFTLPSSENVSANASKTSLWCLFRYPQVKSICRQHAL